MGKTASSLLIGLLAVLLTAGPARASSQLVSEGRALLFSMTYSGIVAADAKFAAAVNAAPNDPEANLFRAVSRTMVFALENSNSGDLGTLADVFTALGMTRTGQDQIDLGPPFTEPGSKVNGAFLLPDTTPSGDELRTFIAGPLLGLLADDLANLAKIADGFTVTLTPQETGDIFPVEIDYSDVLMARSVLYSLQSLFDLIAAHAIPADFQEINRLLNAGVFQLQRDLLNRYQGLLSLRSDAGQTLAAARQALINAVDAGDAAFHSIITEQDDQTDDLLTIDSPADQVEVAEKLYFLTEARSSLAENRVADLSSSWEDWQITTDNEPQPSLWLDIDRGKSGAFLSAELSTMYGDRFICTSWQENGSQVDAQCVADLGSCLLTVTINATIVSGTAISGTYSLAGCDSTGNGTLNGSRQAAGTDPFTMDLRPVFDNSNGLGDLLPEFTENNGIKENSFDLAAWQKPFPFISTQADLDNFLKPNYSLQTTGSVAGTLTCPSCGTGTIYVYARTGPSAFPSMAGNTILTAPGPFTITGLPTGMTVYLSGFLDRDNNGIPSSGDLLGANRQGYAVGATDATLDIATPAVALAGDCNLDGRVDLADAITGMRLLTGQPNDFKAGTMRIDKDGKFGQAEVIFILRYIAGGGF